MTARLLPKPATRRTSPPSVASSWTPRPVRWTCDQFHQMGDAGWFEGQSVILVDGEIIETPVPNPEHDMSVSLTDYKLKALFAPGFVVRIQTGLVLGDDTDAAPDVAVVVGSPRDYKAHPRTAVLVVEVSESSLSYDRGIKASLYAAAGIADYWVIDLVNRQLLVFRDPGPDPSAPHGHTYRQQTALAATDVVAPLALPTVVIAVSELLP